MPHEGPHSLLNQEVVPLKPARVRDYFRPRTCAPIFLKANTTWSSVSRAIRLNYFRLIEFYLAGEVVVDPLT